MERFLIPPDDCLILKAFKDSRSLREAASLLGCDPAGLARRVQQISNHYGFLQKVNNRWQLTSRGLDLVAWTESSIQAQKKILSAKSSVRIATTMWFSEEVLIPHLERLRTLLGENVSVSLSIPHKGFEASLIDGSVDYVIVCHPPENPEIEHKQIAEEKWVLIAPKSWQKELKVNGERIFELLKTRPFIRHSEMNLDLFISDLGELSDSGVMIDNLIGIRSAVCEGLGWSLVPQMLVHRYLKSDRLVEIPFEIPTHDRKVCVWWLRNRYETKRQATKIASWAKEVCL
jgi:DNA-binding transcriptional LysR family regulator